MVNKSFAQWLENELSKRGWSAADLARKAHLTTGAISHVLNGSRSPGPDFCRAVARALHIPQYTVFYIAGLLEDVPDDLSQEEQELVYHFQQLTPDEQEDILAFLRQRARRARTAHGGKKHAAQTP